MQSKSVEGIVLYKTDYSDTSVIIRVLTQLEGVQSFIFPGGKSKKKQGNLLMPLAIVQIHYTQTPKHDLATVRDIESTVVFKEIPFNPYKSCTVFFMNEVLNKTVREQEDNESLYLFLKNALQLLDLSHDISLFPSLFLVQLTNYLGFYPKINDGGRFFDLREGTFVKHVPGHPAYVSEETSTILMALLTAKLDGTNAPRLTLAQRRTVLYELLNYYRFLFDNFKELDSLPILEETLHD